MLSQANNCVVLSTFPRYFCYFLGGNPPCTTLAIAVVAASTMTAPSPAVRKDNFWKARLTSINRTWVYANMIKHAMIEHSTHTQSQIYIHSSSSSILRKLIWLSDLQPWFRKKMLNIVQSLNMSRVDIHTTLSTWTCVYIEVCLWMFTPCIANNNLRMLRSLQCTGCVYTCMFAVFYSEDTAFTKNIKKQSACCMPET